MRFLNLISYLLIYLCYLIHATTNQSKILEGKDGSQSRQIRFTRLQVKILQEIDRRHSASEAVLKSVMDRLTKSCDAIYDRMALYINLKKILSHIDFCDLGDASKHCKTFFEDERRLSRAVREASHYFADILQSPPHSSIQSFNHYKKHQLFILNLNSLIQYNVMVNDLRLKELFESEIESIQNSILSFINQSVSDWNSFLLHGFDDVEYCLLPNSAFELSSTIDMKATIFSMNEVNKPSISIKEWPFYYSHI
jgi:hypothetical protein